MPFTATVVQVFIASPGDTTDAREAILEEAARWNGNNARDRGFVLSPWLYELHGRPELGDRGQGIINRQGIDTSDVVVALFGTTLGSPTEVDISGTVEEIKRAHALGKPVHVYFYSGDIPNPNETDLDRIQEVRAFQKDLQSEGFYGTYPHIHALRQSVRDDLERDLSRLTTPADPDPDPPQSSRVDLRVSHEAQREQVGTDERGKVKYRHTRRDIVIKNEGSATAEQMRFTVTPDSERAHIRMDDLDTDGWTQPRDLPGHSETAVRCIPHARTNAEVTVEWTEDGHPHTQTFITQIT